MKKFILIFPLLLISCKQPVEPIYQTAKSNYAGMWNISLTGNLTGSATIIVDDKGKIENGIPINYYNNLEVTTYLNNYVSEDGKFKSDFYCSKNFLINNEVLTIQSTDGNFIGTFKDSTASGNYDIIINNSTRYLGTWSAYKYKL